MACIFSATELNGGVTCASSALLKPFFEKYLPRLLSLSSNSGRESRRLKMLENRKFGKSIRMRDAEGGAIDENAHKKGAVQVALIKDNNLHDDKRGRVVGQSTGESTGESTEDLWIGSRNWNNH